MAGRRRASCCSRAGCARHRLVQQLPQPQGPGAGDQPARRAAVPLGRTRARGAHRGPGRTGRAPSCRRLFRQPAARFTHRRVGVAAKPGDRVARGAGGAGREGRAEVRDEPAASAVLGRLPAAARPSGSSGRAARAGCTTGCATGATATPGNASGWRRSRGGRGWGGLSAAAAPGRSCETCPPWGRPPPRSSPGADCARSSAGGSPRRASSCPARTAR
jgi:hypothetical protein